MNKYHIAVKMDFNPQTIEKGAFFRLGFDGMSVSIQTAVELAADMNRQPASGVYFPVPAPFAGEI